MPQQGRRSSFDFVMQVLGCTAENDVSPKGATLQVPAVCGARQRPRSGSDGCIAFGPAVLKEASVAERYRLLGDLDLDGPLGIEALRLKTPGHSASSTAASSVEVPAAPKEEAALFDGRFRRGRLIGEGAFGKVHQGVNINTGQKLAIKCEPQGVSRPLLPFEAEILKALAGSVTVPRVHWHGTDCGNTVIVMDLLGLSVDELWHSCSRRFSLKTTLMLAEQMLAGLQEVHDAGVIHRDVKPENFMMGAGPNATRVYMIDFGLAGRYVDPATGRHIALPRGKRSLHGTPRYASIGAHTGSQSRRDDLESLGYTMVALLLGRLPWQGLDASSDELRFDEILAMKKRLPLEELCQECPGSFLQTIRYARELHFMQRPDYMRLQRLLRSTFEAQGYTLDLVFDWSQPGAGDGSAQEDAPLSFQCASVGSDEDEC